MGRSRRAAEGGYVYHVLNRANARVALFDYEEDYLAFEEILRVAVQRAETRLLAYCLMPNDWHLVVWPHQNGELSSFVGWLTLTHTQRLHAFRQSAGSGHIYQGRFKSFPVQDDDHFYSVVRYVERNPLRAGLTTRAEDWRWSSLFQRYHAMQNSLQLLSDWPLGRGANWVEYVNSPQTEGEVAAIRNASRRGRPFGDKNWTTNTANALGLQSTLEHRGRPKKVPGTFFVQS
jgi:putative transposase